MPSFSISLRRSSAWRRARALIVVGERRRRSRFDRRLPSGTKSIASRVARCSGVGRALKETPQALHSPVSHGRDESLEDGDTGK